jgi:feruloyl esterase
VFSGISYSDLAWASSLGFAAVGGNNGHDGNSAAPLLNNPDAVEDFAWRSLYTAAIHGQALTKQFYKNGYKKAYYSGCSTGGRQGWKLAQSFPDLFDGILTGAPALYFSNLLSWIVHYYPLTGPPGSATFVTAPQWGAVQDLVYRQCDTIDGAKDGILEDPSRCHPVLDSLKCSASNSNTTTCLTPTQFKTVLASYFSYQGTHGQILSPSIEPGVEAEEPNNFYNGQPYYSADWWKYAIYNNPDWDPITFTPRDAEYAIAKNPGDIQTSNANLGPFQKHGGKVLGYHGQADTVVTPYISTKYYDAVSATMKLNPHQLDDFFRLFRIGGMNHCGGGNGPTAIGNSQQSSTDYSPENNVLMALVRWVEHDVPPEFVRGKSVTFDGTVAYSRKHCRYPKHNIHFGSKEYTDENSWKCID